VEKGHEKPATLNISWNPHDRAAAARKARRFVLEATLVHVAEALSAFVLATSQLPRFGTIRDRWSGDTPNSKKLSDLVVAALGSEGYPAVGAGLLIHWRNRVVHPKSRASLTPQQKKTLQSNAEEIEQKFAGLAVNLLLEDFEAGRLTLKDISSLISMSIRMAREVERAVRNLSTEDLDFLLRHYGLVDRIKKIEAETSPAKRQSSVIRMLQTEASGLAEPYGRLHSGPKGSG
jgi:predicted HTH domain antitoxin